MITKKKNTKKVVDITMYEDTIVPGIGPDVNFDSLPATVVTDPPPTERKIDHTLLKAGVKDPFLPSVPLDKNTSVIRGGDGKELPAGNTGVKKNERDPFIMDAPVRETAKSMVNKDTVISRM